MKNVLFIYISITTAIFADSKDTKMNTIKNLEECALSQKTFVIKNEYYIENSQNKITTSNSKIIFDLRQKPDNQYCSLINFFEKLQKTIINIKNLKHLRAQNGPEVIIIWKQQIYDKNILSFIKQYKKIDPIIILCEDGSKINNLELKLNEKMLRQKITALKKYHTSQVSRTPFDKIILSMANSSNNNQFFEEYSDPEKNLYTKIQVENLTFGKQTTVIIAAPHPDDAEIGTGGLIQHLKNTNTYTHVINVSLGYRSVINKNEILLANSYSPSLKKLILQHPNNEISDIRLKKKIRQQESQQALQFLNNDIKISALDLPFYERTNYEVKADDFILSYKLIRTILDKNKTSNTIYILAPNPMDKHKAHRQTTYLFEKLTAEIKKLFSHKTIKLIYYNTPWTGMWNLYNYTPSYGTKLAAMIGSELLVGHGNKPTMQNKISFLKAQRYIVSKLSDLKNKVYNYK
jgi:LmbE family N-acetylglucosaminyl deacetylase